MGPFPLTKKNEELLIVRNDYFTKWVEAVSTWHITKDDPWKFIWNNIITQFNIPHTLVTDNGKQFKGNEIKIIMAVIVNARLHEKQRPSRGIK